ncbi:MAG: PepSY domain-containing protein [Capnocytophaga sp.]|nr:PepSY domain-containing protein [Capnocytophaga sp.]
MTISIWRYAHLALSLVASVFVLIASVTGIILAIEPISNQLKPFKSSDFEDVTLSETISVLKNNYAEVLTLEVDDNHFVQVEVIDNEENNSVFYINPKTGEKIGEPFKRSEIFNFSQTLHRSLFMGKVGRAIMAIASFLLMLIAFSGIVLIVRKQKSWKRFFNKLVKEKFFIHYHTFLGRLALIPIFIITFTGVYLSLEVFSLLPTYKSDISIDNELLTEEPRKEITDFEVFAIPLSQVKKLEFPLFEDVEEYYRLKLIDKEVVVNQFTGEILSKSDFPFSRILLHYSHILHTGRGTMVWAIVLFLSCIGILFFLYSGFSITLKRRKSKIKNLFRKEDCSYIILVGSEGGTTLGFANLIYKELIRQGKKAFISEMNAFSVYPKMKHLLVFTSTYGQGNEPINATKFKDLWAKNAIEKPFSYAVVGFGSLAYPDFCKYAYQVDELLSQSLVGKPLLELHTVNNQSFESFSSWANKWASMQGMNLQLSADLILRKKRRQYSFRVIEKTAIQHDETFTITLQSTDNLNFKSGDLFGVISEIDKRERLYSIGKLTDGSILLSIKRHQKGIVSNALNNLKSGDYIQGGIQSNPEFHFPKKTNHVVCIATGTGIAPFLGMIANNDKKVPLTLIWGGKTEVSFDVYKPLISRGLSENKLTDLHLAFSQAENKCYVQDVVTTQAKFFANLLKNNGVIMICGSVAMQKGVTEVLEEICKKHLQKPLSYFQNRKQFRMDCY